MISADSRHADSYPRAHKKASGAFIFVLCFPIWWIFIAQILETVDFPVSLPVGDLSTKILGKHQRGQLSSV
jgi:hypothetical protein